jgi:hypothetical protein
MLRVLRRAAKVGFCPFGRIPSTSKVSTVALFCGSVAGRLKSPPLLIQSQGYRSFSSFQMVRKYCEEMCRHFTLAWNRERRERSKKCSCDSRVVWFRARENLIRALRVLHPPFHLEVESLLCGAQRKTAQYLPQMKQGRERSTTKRTGKAV